MSHINNDDDAKRIYDVIRRAAERETRKRGIPDMWEDVAQTVFVEVLRRDKGGEYDNIGVESGIFSKRIANETRAAVNAEIRDYRHFSGCYLYSRPYVQRLLEDVAWAPEPGSLDEAECRADIHDAYARMAENFRVALWKKYVLGIQPQRRSAEAKTLERATNRLMDYMNAAAPAQATPTHETD